MFFTISCVVFFIYSSILLFVLKLKDMYFDLFQGTCSKEERRGRETKGKRKRKGPYHSYLFTFLLFIFLFLQ